MGRVGSQRYSGEKNGLLPPEGFRRPRCVPNTRRGMGYHSSYNHIN